VKTRHIEVRRTARVVELGASVAAPATLWVVLHGYRQLAHRFLRRFHHLDDGTRRIVAPEALNHFYLDERGGRHGPDHPVGATWMTRHDREAQISDYVAYLDSVVRRLRAEVGTATPLFVLGFSQGQHTVARWLALGETRPRGAVFWGDVMPGDLPPETGGRLGALRCVRVRGRDDGHLDPKLLAADAARWEAWGVAADTVTHPGGHEVEPASLARVVAALEGDHPL
jgi:predicted esterase